MYKRSAYYGGRREKRRHSLRKKIFSIVLPFLAGCLFMLLAPDIPVQSAEGMPEEAKERGMDPETVEIVNEMITAGLWKDFPEGLSERDEAADDMAPDPAVIGEDRPVRERSDILVAIDAGHGGEDEGCSRENILEKDINRKIAESVQTRLAELGYRVLLIREGDGDVTLSERAGIANDAGADIYVSIHQNACEEDISDTTGIETWYNEGKAEAGSKRLAQLIHSDLLVCSGARDRGLIADNSLYVIRETDMPACLVETGFLSSRTEREKLLTPEYQESLAKAIASGIDLYFFPKTMYLTFDDGPTPKNTDAVLDILRDHDIRATFFLVGESVEKYPEVAERILREGHTIGIHCYSHDYKKLYASVDSYVEDFEKARGVIRDILGVEVDLFRFPGGSINSYNKKVYAEIAREMTERGYYYFDWNACLGDASKNNRPEQLLQNAKDSTLGRRKVVMLAHDTVSNTVQCLEELIEQFPEYEMLPLAEDVEPIRF